MKNKLIKVSLLCFVFVVFSLSGRSAVQTTFTKSGPVITVWAKPDASYAGILNQFACSFRYLNSGSVTLAITSNPIVGIEQGETITDPLDADYNITNFVNYTTNNDIAWSSGVEYPICTITVSGGIGNNHFALVSNPPEAIFADIYYQFANGSITNINNPFYSGSDHLDISSITDGTYGIFHYASESQSWLTSGTSNWNSNSNWSFGFPPQLTDNVTIPSGGTQPVISTSAVCKNLNVLTGAFVTVAETGTLTVDGNLTIADDYALWVKSLPTGTGSLIVNGTVPLGNKVLIERYFAPTTWSNNDDGWHLLSSPVAGQVIPLQFTTPDLSPDRYDFYSWDETVSTWLNIKDGTNPEGTFSTFGVGKGYIASYEGWTTGTTKQFIGALNNSNVGLSLTHTGVAVDGSAGYNLLGNPFSSAITYNTAGWNLSNVGTKATQIWNNATKGYVTIADGAIIPAMNGFMVYAGDGGGSLTIPLAARLHSSTPFYKSSEPQITLVAHDPEGASLKSSMIRLNSEATAGFDLAYDAYMLGGYAPSFYSTANNSAFTINTIPALNNGLVIPFGFVKNGSTNFSIELAENINGTLLVLRDKKTNTMVNMSQGSSYAFTSAEGDDANRFELLFGTQVGIEESGALAAASVYNVNGQMVVSNVKGDTQMNIFNVQGQLLKNFQFNSNGNHEISVNLPTGIYMVRLSNGGVMKTMKVFVN